jgi:hypothetical protein
MKRKILIMALALSSVPAVQAQSGSKTPETNTAKVQRQNKTPDERADMEADRAEKELGLNADQKAKWEAAVKERAAANSGLKEKMKGSTTPEERKQLHAQLKANNQKFDESASVFLNADQKAKYDQRKNERMEKRKGKRGKDSERYPAKH